MGPAIAAAARPTAERDGVLTVTCDAAVWAQELDLMADELIASPERRARRRRRARAALPDRLSASRPPTLRDRPAGARKCLVSGYFAGI